MGIGCRRFRGGGEGPPLGWSEACWFGYLQVQDLTEVAFMAVDQGVVVSAEQTEVGEDGFAAVCP